MAAADPQFVELDPAKITADLVAQFEALSGRTLYPAQYERLLIDLLAYLSVVNRSALQEACKQQLVRYSSAPILDRLGELVGVTRLEAQGAQTTLQFTLAAALLVDLVIPSGFQVQTRDGGATFATVQALLVPAGLTQGQVIAECQTPGNAWDGYQPGDICVPLQALPAGVSTVMNITGTSGGANPETDDHLRLRIMSAPDQFSSAGPAGAYRYHAMSASPDVVDVAVETPEPGVVAVYPLLATGIPAAEVLMLIHDTLSAETVRPLCDEVRVLAPVQVPFAVHANLTLYATADPVAVMAAAQAAALLYRQDRQGGLGRDLIGAQLLKALAVDGVYDVELVGWANQALGAHQWAHCSSINLVMSGLAHG